MVVCVRLLLEGIANKNTSIEERERASEHARTHARTHARKKAIKHTRTRKKAYLQIEHERHGFPEL